MSTALKSAAEKYVSDCYSDAEVSLEEPVMHSFGYQGFLSGASFERARIFELLRSVDEDLDYFNHKTNHHWATWLETKLKEMDGGQVADNK